MDAVAIASTHYAYTQRDGQAELVWVDGWCLLEQSFVPVLIRSNVVQLLLAPNHMSDVEF